MTNLSYKGNFHLDLVTKVWSLQSSTVHQSFMPPAWKFRRGHLVIGSSVCLSVHLSVRNSGPLTNKVQYLNFGWSYSNQTCTVSSSMGFSQFTDITCPWGWVQNVGLRDFCHILTLLLPGASAFHKHISSCFVSLHDAVFESPSTHTMCQNLKLSNVFGHSNTLFPCSVLTSMCEKCCQWSYQLNVIFIHYRNDLYLLSVITTILKVVENLSLFLSPYLKDIVFQVSLHHSYLYIWIGEVHSGFTQFYAHILIVRKPVSC